MRRVNMFEGKRGARTAGSESTIVNGRPTEQNRMQMSVREIPPGLRVKSTVRTSKDFRL